MDDWTTRYRHRLITTEEAADIVADGDLVAVGIPEPTVFLTALGERDDLEHIDVFVPAPRVGGVDVGRNGAVRLLAPFLTQYLRDAGVDAEVLPARLQDWANMYERLAPRVRVVQVGTPGLDGRVPPGSAIGGNDGLVRRRGDGDVVIGLVNPAMPDIPGDAFHVDDFDHLIPLPADADPMPIFDTRKQPPDLDAFVSALDELIPDRSTVQAGVGGIAEAALERLTHKRDLGVHTEVFGPGLAKLVACGAANGRAKSVHRGEVILTIALPETYAFADRNPALNIQPAAIALDPANIAKNSSMRCINSALEVDLWGQVNAEMIDGRQYSGVGGQLDFLRGCSLANDALAINVLPSTAAGGTRSRIVLDLGRNAATGTRYDTQVVVTEHGVAWLRDATIAQRAERLIAIAHPDFRDELTEDARRRGMLR